MTSDEADQRIELSRRTLSAYIRGIQRTGKYPLSEMTHVVDEIAHLEDIAREHPASALVILELLTWWKAFQATLKSKLN
ncbi:MAG: hypothetical protein P0Y65_13510 [Candidatus Devosia phytovorans]|uniref:Uncharacterized protein n=1 Tax=Candidatus Devosia phytovorans TaxID=3121372 RepID=A0AAJ6AYZ4_9HYPH|nr:hypothetical protein [Devosia sp.]WEK03216.1 MAG: hypothetical protein P0Y65_13510 [Devosia sp.]